jgi:HEAT repeat protein
MILVKMYSWRFVMFLLGVTCLVLVAFALGAWYGRADQPDYEGLHSADPAERAAVVQTIRRTGDVEAVAQLLDSIADPDPAVGLYVAQALGDLATTQALEALRADLGNVDPNVRFRAALALGQSRDGNAAAALTRALRDPDVLVQRTAAESLAQIGTPEAVDSLVSGLSSQQDSIVHNAMNALQVIGDAAVFDLMEALNSSNPVVRTNAATVLGYIKSPIAVKSLEAAAADRDPNVVKEAAWALAETQNRR